MEQETLIFGNRSYFGIQCAELVQNDPEYLQAYVLVRAVGTISKVLNAI